MTENEVIESLEYLKEQLEDDSPDMFTYTGEEIEALKTAISALEEIQQYLALGTVEEIKSLIAESEEEFDMLMEYRKIGTVEELREAMEKQRAKKPRLDGDGYAPDGTFVWDEWLCPNCNSRFEVDYDDYDYCPNCGQRIDHSWLTEGD